MSQKLGCNIAKEKTPGVGSVIILARLSSVLVLTASRNVGKKKAEGCMLYNSS